MKKILITGASRGLGKALTEFFSNEGHLVYGTVRNLEGFTETDNTRYFYLDLQDVDSIKKTAHQILQEVDSFDAIIHNAGIAYKDPADVLTEQEVRSTFDVNFFGPWLLTRELLPRLMQSRAGKLVFISSIASVDHWPGLGVYSASKAALECIAFEWAVLLKKWGISVSIIRPNPLPTDMQIRRSSNSPSSPYKKYTCNELIWESISDVCKTALKIINSRSPKFEYTSGVHSQEAINAIQKKGAYNKLMEKYQEKLKGDVGKD